MDVLKIKTFWYNGVVVRWGYMESGKATHIGEILFLPLLGIMLGIHKYFVCAFYCWHKVISKVANGSGGLTENKDK